jgi:hypothetical protein
MDDPCVERESQGVSDFFSWTDLAFERDAPLLWVELVDGAHEGRMARLEDCWPALVLPCDARDERWSYAGEIPACAEHAGTQCRERDVRVLS